MLKVRLISVTLVLFLIASISTGCSSRKQSTENDEGSSKPTVEARVKTISQANIGEYVQFGRYYNEPILWKVVDKSNGVMLVSEKILCLKPFDAAESGFAGKSGGNFSTDEKRQMYGSNVWSNSNIREWLNSSMEKVDYSTQAPNNDAVWGGINDYADEQGFLYDFTEKERDAIQSVEHDGVKDKVYLLSESELSKAKKLERELTSIGLEKSEIKELKKTQGNDVVTEKPHMYWLRTPNTNASACIEAIDNRGMLTSDYLAYGAIGVLPAFNLKSKTAILEGEGTEDKPFIVTNEESSKSTSTTNKRNLKQVYKGDYILFGKYYDEPILWKVVDKSNGIMLASENILCLKAFDAAESGNYGKLGGNFTADKNRQYNGSNDWSNSNIREWLNSSSVKVSYTTQPPTNEAVGMGWNDYAGEPGFLFNFTESERKEIQDMKHEGVTDKVYLLSDVEVSKIGELKKTLTTKGFEKSEIKEIQGDKLSDSMPLPYWLRTHDVQHPDTCLEQHLDYEGRITDSYACVGFVGVVPALNLKTDAVISEGEGTKEKPFIVTGE